MKKIISILISLIILAFIYWQIDLERLIQVFQNSDIFWLIISLATMIPIILTNGWRLQILMPKNVKLSFREANKFILLGNVLNVVLPSNMGTIAKAYFITKKGYLSSSLALSLVVFEKAWDLLSLLIWCVFGLILYPQGEKPPWLGIITVIIVVGIVFLFLFISSPRFFRFFIKKVSKVAPKVIIEKLENLQQSWQEVHGYLWGNKMVISQVAIISILIWLINLLQIWLFTFALKSSVPFLANLALAPLAILVGLLPLTFGGIGTRDAALIFFYQPYINETVGAALGLLCTSRYILPALAGLPFIKEGLRFGKY